MTNEETKQKLIVLIEDEEILSNLLIQKLEKAGYQVKSALDGEMGLQLINEAKPDLVLLDMMLPKMNGFQILEELTAKKTLPSLPIIIISNSGQPIEIDRALKMGVKDYLIKVNFNPEEVLMKVSNVFNTKEKAREPEPTLLETEDIRKNILIVEDDVFMAGLLERKFKQNNYKILKASSANQAKEVLAKNKVDLILLDVVLPGTDGFVFLKEIKADEKLRAIPVIIISNLGQQEEIERGLAGGAADYIVKAHTSPGEIVEKVKLVIK